MKRPTKKSLTGLASSIALCAMGLIATPQTAQAAHTRIHAQACMPQYSTGTPIVNNLGTGGYQVNDATQWLSCPVTDNDRLRKSDIGAIEVYTHDGSSSGNNFIRVRACATSRSTNSAACGTRRAGTGSGFKKITLGPSELHNITTSGTIAWYADLRVEMVSTSIYAQRLIGYTISD